MSEAEKHSAEWCRQNPSQAASDLFSLKLAVVNAKNLIEGGQPHQMEEAKTWLANASKI